jgi:hypothetical protein
MPSLETILQHPDLGKSVVARETMLALRACCRAGRAVVDRFAEEVWYPSFFQEILESARLDQLDRFLNMWRVDGWMYEFLNRSIAKGADGRIRIFFFDDPRVLLTHENVPAFRYMLEIGLQCNGLDVRVVSSGAKQEDGVGSWARLERPVISVNMLRKFLLSEAWHPKRQGLEDRDWPVERGIETREQKHCLSAREIVIDCIETYRGLEMNRIECHHFGTDSTGNLIVLFDWTTGRRTWLHEARMCFACPPRDVMKLEICSDNGSRKRYRGIRSAGRMLQILYYKPWHPLRQLPNEAGLEI